MTDRHDDPHQDQDDTTIPVPDPHEQSDVTPDEHDLNGTPVDTDIRSDPDDASLDDLDEDGETE